MQFIAKNLSWGIFKNAFSSTEFPEAQGFYEHYLEALNKFNVKCEEPELLLFTIIELLGSTSYNCILYKQPVTMQEYLPHLHRILHQLLIAFTEEANRTTDIKKDPAVSSGSFSYHREEEQ